MDIYLGNGDQAQTISKLYVGVGGAARPVQKVYAGVDGAARLVYRKNIPVGEMNAGDIVKFKISGEEKDFIIVHQGLPSNIYDSSCDGTWVLMKDLYEKINNSTVSNYPATKAYAYLKDTFYDLIEEPVKSSIKQVTIKYNTTKNGQTGVAVKVFLLSSREVGFTDGGASEKVGSKLDYFDSQSKRIAYYQGVANDWVLRDTKTNTYFNYLWHVGKDGSGNEGTGYNYVRPAFVLPKDFLVDDEGRPITA